MHLHKPGQPSRHPALPPGERALLPTPQEPAPPSAQAEWGSAKVSRCPCCLRGTCVLTDTCGVSEASISSRWLAAGALAAEAMPGAWHSAWNKVCAHPISASFSLSKVSAETMEASGCAAYLRKRRRSEHRKAVTTAAENRPSRDRNE